MVAAYFSALKQTLILAQYVDSFRIVREQFGNRDGLIRIKCHLVGGDTFEFAEYVQIAQSGRIQRVTYSYHWQTRAGLLIKRWDNAPHHKELAGFPDHLHDGDKVKPSKPVTLSRSLSDLGDRSENLTGRGQILSFLKVNSCSIDRKSGEI